MKHLLIIGLMFAGMLRGAVMEGRLETDVLVGGSGRVMILSPKGEIKWEQRKTGLVHDVWMLPNGNVLFADGNVHEVTPDHREIFTYRPKVQAGGGAYSCQRLPNGNTVVGENASGRVVEVDPSGKVVFAMTTQYGNSSQHHHFRTVRKLTNGNYLVSHSGLNMVREYTPDGTVVWELKTKALAFTALRLPNGNTLVASLSRITEYTPEKTVAWEFHDSDIPGTVIRNMCGVQVLPNGNFCLGCYSAYDRKTKAGVGCLEITREKKLVWSYAAPEADASLMPIQKLVPGIPFR